MDLLHHKLAGGVLFTHADVETKEMLQGSITVLSVLQTGQMVASTVA